MQQVVAHRESQVEGEHVDGARRREQHPGERHRHDRASGRDDSPRVGNPQADGLVVRVTGLAHLHDPIEQEYVVIEPKPAQAARRDRSVSVAQPRECQRRREITRRTREKQARTR
jgi:hypothetical protein